MFGDVVHLQVYIATLGSKTMGTNIVKHSRGGGMAAAQTKANLGGIEEAGRTRNEGGRKSDLQYLCFHMC